jgi:hypothetical protein
MDSLDPLGTAVEDLFRNSVLFVVLNKASRAVSIKDPKAEAIPMCPSKDCTRGLASAYGLLVINSAQCLKRSPANSLRHVTTAKSSHFGATSHHKLSDQSQY